MAATWKLILAALVFTGGGAVAQETKLTGNQIKAELVGKSGTWKSADGKLNGTTRISGSTQDITGNFQGFSEDRATWRIKGNQFCNTFSKIRQGKEFCQDIRKIGPNQYKFGNNTVLTLG